MFHTLHVPRRTSDPGMWEADAYLAQHVAQLNAAGRHVAQSLQYHIVDVEAMAAQMSQESVLIDNTHPGPDFMMQVSSRSLAQTKSDLVVWGRHSAVWLMCRCGRCSTHSLISELILYAPTFPESQW